MGKLLKYPVIIFLFTVLIAAPSGAQDSVKSLQEQIKKLEEDIKRNTQLLEKTRSDQKVSQSELKLVLNRISSRRQMVGSLQKQMELLEAEISRRQKTVAGMDKELDDLKKDYARMVREAYKNHKLNNFALFLFASDDFNQAARRIEFMRRYNGAREARARRIREYSDSLTMEIAGLDRQKEELEGTRKTHTSEIDNLTRDERRYRTSVDKLKQEESKITRELKAKQQQMEKAQKEIEKIIAAEAAKNNKEVRTAAEQEYIVNLTGKFEDNKGKLPYPVRGGVIVDKYGKQQDAAQRGLTHNNTGVNIAGEKGAGVYCAFEGTVSVAGFQNGFNSYLIIRHGNYFTLYANLASFDVKAGDKVSVNQKIGNLSQSANPDDVFVHFEIWKNNGSGKPSNLNPEPWLRK